MTTPSRQPGPGGIAAYVGKTPLLHLRHLSQECGCEIYAKAEFMNPGGSVKDRAALGMILDAEARGLLSPGGTIVEGTAGNTGIGLTLLGQARGYRSVIVIPETQSPEKIALLRAIGAEVRPVPEKPYSDPDNYNHLARRIAQDNGWFWADQFDNPANRLAHYQTTGPEIARQTREQAGRLDAFVASVGTGGTLAGTALYLKETDPAITTICADPYGAGIWSWVTHGHTGINDGDSWAEGIGQNRITRNLEGAPIDLAYRIADHEAIPLLHRLLREEGLFLGLSSAINIAGALRYAQEAGPGRVIATVLCDSGAKYQSRLYNPLWLQANGFPPIG